MNFIQLKYLNGIDFVKKVLSDIFLEIKNVNFLMMKVYVDIFINSLVIVYNNVTSLTFVHFVCIFISLHTFIILMRLLWYIKNLKWTFSCVYMFLIYTHKLFFNFIMSHYLLFMCIQVCSLCKIILFLYMLHISS